MRPCHPNYLHYYVQAIWHGGKTHLFSTHMFEDICLFVPPTLVEISNDFHIYNNNNNNYSNYVITLYTMITINDSNDYTLTIEKVN